MAERLVGRWWNGTFGRLARRDIWLVRDSAGYHVRARDGGEDGRELVWAAFATEEAARVWVRRLMSASPGSIDRWQDLTAAVRREEERLRWPSGPYTPREGEEES